MIRPVALPGRRYPKILPVTGEGFSTNTPRGRFLNMIDKKNMGESTTILRDFLIPGFSPIPPLPRVFDNFKKGTEGSVKEVLPTPIDVISILAEELKDQNLHKVDQDKPGSHAF